MARAAIRQWACWCRLAIDQTQHGLVEVVGSAVKDDLTGMHAHHPVGKLLRQVNLVQAAEHRGAVLLRGALEQCQNVATGVGIEACHRLIGEDHQGLQHKGAGDPYALLLAAAERTGAPRQMLLAEPDLSNQLAGPASQVCGKEV